MEEIVFKLLKTPTLFDFSACLIAQDYEGKEIVLREFVSEVPISDVEALVSLHLRHLIIERMDAMERVRSSNYIMGYLPPSKQQYVHKLIERIHSAKNIKNVRALAEYINDNIMHLFQAIEPSESSRYYRNYRANFKRLSDLINAIRTNKVKIYS